MTRGQQVTWLEGLDPNTETIKKIYSADTPILQAFWCRFPDEGGGAKGCGCVCIREQGCLGIYMDSGAVYFVPFLFPVSTETTIQTGSLDSSIQVKWVWPLDCGVVVERQLAAGSAYDGFPTLFSLLHPLDDFCPLTCHRHAASESRPCTNFSQSHPSLPTADSGVKVVGFFGEPGLEVVDVCYSAPYQLPLVLSYHSTSRQHHIWALRHTTKEVCICVCGMSQDLTRY